MAFFVELRDNSRFHSTIKFGGWDAIGLQGGADGLNLIKTRNKGTWDLRMKKFAIQSADGDSENSMTGRYFFRFEPQLPYLYLPAVLYNNFTDYIKNKYPEIECDEDRNICRWNEPCEEVTAQPITLIFTLYEEKGGDFEYPFLLDWNSMKIPGSKFGESDNQCFFPVFYHG